MRTSRKPNAGLAIKSAVLEKPVEGSIKVIDLVTDIEKKKNKKIKFYDK